MFIQSDKTDNNENCEEAEVECCKFKDIAQRTAGVVTKIFLEIGEAHGLNSSHTS